MKQIAANSALAAIGLGSNLDDPVRQVRLALESLAELAHTDLLASSSLYRNPPMGPPDQPDFINAAALLRTRLQPLALLQALQRIERAQGRTRDVYWGARTLDLDLLLYDQQVIDSALLTVPHPGLHERAFVLHPLAEIAPDLIVPGKGKVGLLAAEYSAAELTKIEPLESRLDGQCG